MNDSCFKCLSLFYIWRLKFCYGVWPYSICFEGALESKMDIQGILRKNVIYVTKEVSNHSNAIFRACPVRKIRPAFALFRGGGAGEADKLNYSTF